MSDEKTIQSQDTAESGVEEFILPEIISVPKAVGPVTYVNVCDSSCA
ncbi:MAG: hypothetical protein MUF15_25790 [Acidobacteria bacterium]|jgi:hypothetical protein|nr:hypothetical protein [Acidobacteriota bacterium]